jgi:cyclopropane-fatty-acyl-phospholipid synthase
VPWSERVIFERLVGDADIGVDGRRPWDLQVHDPRFFRRFLLGGTLALGESYMDGWWDCEALDQLFDRALRARLDQARPLQRGRLALSLAGRMINLQTRARARVVGVRHYDLGTDLFTAMLGPSLQYSCAYYKDTADLTVAQQQKLVLIARKLDLRPGQRILDIGCGWGGLARHLAEHHRCQVVGITISRDQAEYAAAACRGWPVEIRLQDYREVHEPFDRVVSVGMLEHVGWRNYRTYFDVVQRVLPQGGLFLCHTIGGHVSRHHTDPWISRYVFPNSLLPSAAQVSRAADGRFVLEDVHNFGADYDRTLCAWHRNFAAAWNRLEPQYGERFGRMWRYYLLSCAGAFRARSLQLYQFVFSKGGVRGGYASVR